LAGVRQIFTCADERPRSFQKFSAVGCRHPSHRGFDECPREHFLIADQPIAPRIREPDEMAAPILGVPYPGEEPFTLEVSHDLADDGLGAAQVTRAFADGHWPALAEVQENAT
jgi:hypothetical protein